MTATPSGAATSAKFDTTQFNKSGDRQSVKEHDLREIAAYKRGSSWLARELHGLEVFCRAVTDNENLRLRIGPIPCTDGDTIYLKPPKLYDDDPDPDAKIMAYMWHEIAHVLKSQVFEPADSRKTEDAIKIKGNKLYGEPSDFMWNALEDGRVEKHLYIEAPGAEKHIVKNANEQTPIIIASAERIGREMGDEHMIATADQDLIESIRLEALSFMRARSSEYQQRYKDGTSTDELMYDASKELEPFQKRILDVARQTGDAEGGDRIAKNIEHDIGILMTTYLETAGYTHLADQFPKPVTDALRDPEIQKWIEHTHKLQKSWPVMTESTQYIIKRLRELGFFVDWDPRALNPQGEPDVIDWNDLTDDEKEALRNAIKQQKGKSSGGDPLVIKNAPKDLFDNQQPQSQQGQGGEAGDESGEQDASDSGDSDLSDGMGADQSGRPSPSQSDGDGDSVRGNGMDSSDSPTDASGDSGPDSEESDGDSDDDFGDGDGRASRASDSEDEAEGRDSGSQSDVSSKPVAGPVEAEDQVDDGTSGAMDNIQSAEGVVDEYAAPTADDKDTAEALTAKRESAKEGIESKPSSVGDSDEWTEADEAAAKALHERNEIARVNRANRFRAKFGAIEDKIRPPHIEYVTKAEAERLIPRDEEAQKIQTAQNMEVGEIAGGPENRFLFRERRPFVTPQDAKNAPTLDKYNELIAGEVNRLRAVFKNNEKYGFYGQYEIGTHINDRALPGFIVGEHLKPFNRKSVPKKLSYAVTLLIDMSGSMNGQKIITARTALAMQASLLDKLRVPCEILGFSTKGVGGYYWDGRYEVQHHVFKTFDEPWTPEQRAKVMSIGTEDTNLDGLALSWAWGRLSRRPEQIKILMTYSDGQPNPDTDRQVRIMRFVLGKMQAAGAIAIGVGIQSEAPKGLYPTAVFCDNIATLPRLVTRLLEAELKKKR